MAIEYLTSSIKYSLKKKTGKEKLNIRQIALDIGINFTTLYRFLNASSPADYNLTMETLDLICTYLDLEPGRIILFTSRAKKNRRIKSNANTIYVFLHNEFHQILSRSKLKEIKTIIEQWPMKVSDELRDYQLYGEILKGIYVADNDVEVKVSSFKVTKWIRDLKKVVKYGKNNGMINPKIFPEIYIHTSKLMEVIENSRSEYEERLHFRNMRELRVNKKGKIVSETPIGIGKRSHLYRDILIYRFVCRLLEDTHMDKGQSIKEMSNIMGKIGCPCSIKAIGIVYNSLPDKFRII